MNVPTWSLPTACLNILGGKRYFGSFDCVMSSVTSPGGSVGANAPLVKAQQSLAVWIIRSEGASMGEM